MGRVLGFFARYHQPISNWVTTTAVKSEVTTPISRVQAKPRTAPAPNMNMMTAEMALVMLASRMDTRARW